MAIEAEVGGDYQAACGHLEEALRLGFDEDLALDLSRLLRLNKEEDQAYALIKALPDLFSRDKVLEEYGQVLAANNFLIEALQVKHLTEGEVDFPVLPADKKEQEKILLAFRRKQAVSQSQYEQLLKLDLPTYLAFARSLLLDPLANYALRLAVCEDLVKLGVKEEMQVMILGDLKSFVPAETDLLKQDPVYREFITSLASRYQNRPSELPLILAEGNFAFGQLYPCQGDYVTNPDAFARDLTGFLRQKRGGESQDLLEKIYQKK
ncbi:BS_ysoA-like protein with TPR repeats [Lactobacillus delbrueckii subsp. bulgaricus ND02]|nr:BS_ysoA-like protein with TPR repeats [Lactobacillus delbrueckii subsp. bulgaricus ND02]